MTPPQLPTFPTDFTVTRTENFPPGSFARLRVGNDRNTAGGWDTISWPGYTLITGDIGHWLFALDLHHFLNADEDNLGYFAGKIRAGEPARIVPLHKVRTHLAARIWQQRGDHAALGGLGRRFPPVGPVVAEARERLRRIEHDDITTAAGVAAVLDPPIWVRGEYVDVDARAADSLEDWNPRYLAALAALRWTNEHLPEVPF